MKKLFKSAVFWVLLVEVIAVIVLFLFGFRITYNPNLITDWEAVSAVAGWVSAMATILIPIVAVIFQNKLDENKNAMLDVLFFERADIECSLKLCGVFTVVDVIKQHYAGSEH